MHAVVGIVQLKNIKITKLCIIIIIIGLFLWYQVLDKHHIKITSKYALMLQIKSLATQE